MTAAYGDNAKRYLKRGWWPIPVKGKAYPEPGTTGKSGVVTAESAKALLVSRRLHNVAVRHVDTVALDIDAADHDGKRGDKTLARKVAKWGKLPPTWSSTARGDDSTTRQYFYRVTEGTLLVSDLGPGSDVEVIHHGHRYSVVAPSVHPDTGELYVWYSPTGERSARPPHVDELPDLPEKWVRKLTVVPYVAPEAKATGTPPSPAALDLSSDDRDRVARWLGTALDGIRADLDELTAKATGRAEDYRGDPWDATTFAKAVRLAELARAAWSSFSLDEARELLLEHAPRDEGFTDKDVLEKWASALRASQSTELALPITAGQGGAAALFTLPIPDHMARRQRLSPGSFFDPKEGLLVEQTGDAIAYDLGVGPDGAVWLYEGGVWSRRDDEIERRLVRLLGDRYRSGMLPSVRSAVTKGRDLPVIGHEPNSRLINVQNGMVDWLTGELEPHDPAHLSTIQLPLDYDPAATCPAVDGWLDEVLSATSVPLSWETMGYLFMSGNPLQTAVLLHGGGGNGKGTWLRLATRCMGTRNTSALSLNDITEGKFELAGTFGKLANVAGDIDPKRLANTAKLKAFTGGDMILVQHKHGQPFEFTPWAVPIFSANLMWQSADTTDGYLRRWLTIPFPNAVDKERTAIYNEAALFAETAGVFNKALAALRRLMGRGKFELLGDAADLKRRFDLEADVVRVWLEDDERVARHDAGNTTLSTRRDEAYRRYTFWAKDNGHIALNSSNFYKRLERLGYALAVTNDKRVVLGLELGGALVDVFALPGSS